MGPTKTVCISLQSTTSAATQVTTVMQHGSQRPSSIGLKTGSQLAQPQRAIKTLKLLIIFSLFKNTATHYIVCYFLSKTYTKIHDKNELFLPHISFENPTNHWS